ncbi:MAG: universal stress protein [Acidobacteria bacterium]|nr:universal stress protein [Acidobacteriota bacterium]
MKVLIATDGSEFSRAAIEKTCRVFELTADSEIRVVCVYPPVVPIDAFPQSLEYSEQLENKERVDSEAIAAAAVALLKERVPAVTKVETLVKSGAPDQIVLDTAKEWPADVIVVGSHGRGFWGRLTIGSISDSIVHHASCSVLVVK